LWNGRCERRELTLRASGPSEFDASRIKIAASLTPKTAAQNSALLTASGANADDQALTGALELKNNMPRSE